MIKFVLAGVLFLILASCGQKSIEALVPAHTVLSNEEIDSFKYNMIRYIGKLPGKADHITKFDTVFNDYYKHLATQHELVYYVKKDNGDIYFMLTRIAPSLHEKKVAIAGKVRLDSKSEIESIEEIFRTWKMLVPELKEKSDMLFQLLLEGKDLSPYYTENSKGVEYIEFPNEHVKYDTTQRLWISSLEDPLEPYYDMKR